VTALPSDKNDKRSKFNVQIHTGKRVYHIAAETLEEQRSWFVSRPVSRRVSRSSLSVG
jgi:hypothetical protein